MATGKYQEWLQPDNLIRLEGWARNGLTDEQIAHNIGISVKTLYDWKNNHSDICNALKKGKEVVDIEVENALLKRALGYSYTEKKTTKSDKDGEKIEVIEKHMPPDTTAQIFWLKNRRPSEWRDKRNIELAGNADDTIKEMEAYFEKQRGNTKPTVE